LDHLRAIVRAAGGVSPPRARARQAIVLQHPCGHAPAREQRVVERILRAVRAEGLHALVSYPNSDSGHTGIVAGIHAAANASDNGDVHVVRSMPRDDFLQVLMTSRVLIGNSSAGIIEAATAGTPSVNVGNRQAGRLRAGPSVIDCGEDYASIRRALQRALRARPRTTRVYGAGDAGRKIAEILASIPLNRYLWHKRIAY